MTAPTVSMPILRLEVNGSPLPGACMALLSAVEVQQRLGLPAHIELTFSASGDSIGQLSGLAPLLAPGSPLVVDVQSLAGSAGRASELLFRGEITAQEWRYGAANRRDLVVRGYDALHRLGRRQSMRAFANLTPASLAGQLGREVGLAVSAQEKGPVWTSLYQHRQTDLALLQEFAGRCGLYPAVRGATLHLFTLAGDGSSLALRLGDNLVEAQVEVNPTAGCGSVEVLGWDPQRSIPIQARAGPRLEGDSRSLPDAGAVDRQQAAAFAQAELDRRRAAQVVFRGLALGDPALQPGRSVQVEGLEPGLNARYVLTEVNHSLDARRGFVSRLSTHPPQPPARARSAVATLGVVIRVDDPEKTGRVRVALPAYGGVETDWIGVLCAGAGPGKGLVALPNLADTVLVLLVHEDPGQALVLGGLYGQERLADDGVEGDAVKRYSFRTAEGQFIQLDDRSLRLENSAGSFVELSPDRLHIFSHAPLTIEAPGSTVLIRANQVDFEQG